MKPIFQIQLKIKSNFMELAARRTKRRMFVAVKNVKKTSSFVMNILVCVTKITQNARNYKLKAFVQLFLRESLILMILRRSLQKKLIK
jgi:vacuolar-type H+-ATPase catalytic subunit A/Vma1